jgi:hypothetical protein
VECILALRQQRPTVGRAALLRSLISHFIESHQQLVLGKSGTLLSTRLAHRRGAPAKQP